jgi:hypothetical protein
LKSAPRTLHYKVEEIFSICPTLLINAELSIGPKAGKRIPLKLGGQFSILGTNVSAFTNILTSMF